MPTLQPRRRRFAVEEESTQRRFVTRCSMAQETPGACEVHLFCMQQLQPVAGQCAVQALVVGRAQQPQLGTLPLLPVRLVPAWEVVDDRRRLCHGRVAVVVQQRQQRLSQARQVPPRDGRLLAIGITAAMVDGAEHRLRVISFHEGAGSVVDGLA